MSRAGNKFERELLRGIRKSKLRQNLNGKECSNSACQDYGKIQPPENFYTRGAKLDSYCIICRRARNIMWKLEHPVTNKKIPKLNWNMNLGKAPWCKDHKVNSKKCGCALGLFHKTPLHKAHIAKSMKGNSNAKGKHKSRGPLSEEHKAKIAAAIRNLNKEKSK